MILLKNLIVTHNELRHKESLNEMSNFVASGKIYDKIHLENFSKIKNFSKPSPVIQITQFEDGQLFVHDGHHRIVSCFLGGRFFLADQEYEITRWNYKEYMEISYDQEWYTPFDPRTHVRVPDFNSFKKRIKDKLLSGESMNQITDWINDNKHLYCCKRLVFSVKDLVDSIIGR